MKEVEKIVIDGEEIDLVEYVKHTELEEAVEEWIFTLEDGSEVAKKIYVKA